jgi:hypothetical protein
MYSSAVIGSMDRRTYRHRELLSSITSRMRSRCALPPVTVFGRWLRAARRGSNLRHGTACGALAVRRTTSLAGSVPPPTRLPVTKRADRWLISGSSPSPRRRKNSPASSQRRWRAMANRSARRISSQCERAGLTARPFAVLGRPAVASFGSHLVIGQLPGLSHGSGVGRRRSCAGSGLRGGRTFNSVQDD